MPMVIDIDKGVELVTDAVAWLGAQRESNPLILEEPSPTCVRSGYLAWERWPGTGETSREMVYYCEATRSERLVHADDAQEGERAICTTEAVVTRQDPRTTSAPFSKEEITLIKSAILTPGTMVDCPRCGTLLKVDAYSATDVPGAKALWVFCETCKRNLIVRDVSTESESP